VAKIVGATWQLGHKINVIDFMPELLTKVVVPLSLPVWGLSEGDSLA